MSTAPTENERDSGVAWAREKVREWAMNHQAEDRCTQRLAAAHPIALGVYVVGAFYGHGTRDFAEQSVAEARRAVSGDSVARALLEEGAAQERWTGADSSGREDVAGSLEREDVQGIDWIALALDLLDVEWGDADAPEWADPEPADDEDEPDDAAVPHQPGSHLHQVQFGLRQRLAAIGARVVSVDMTGSEDRGQLVGHVPLYTVVLGRDDKRTLTFPLSTGATLYEPDAFDVVDTLLCTAGLHVDEGMGDAETAGLVIATSQFLEGPDCWQDWLRYTDRDPGRQDDYDEEPDEDEPDDEESAPE